MSATNVKATKRENVLNDPFVKLQRTIMSCLLWEDNFYENGEEIGERIKSLSEQCSVEQLEKLVLESKFNSKLRHVPLLLMCLIAKKHGLTKNLVEQVITRVDDMAELISLYKQGSIQCIPNQMKKGLQKAFTKFDEYQFAKYKGDKKAIKLRDVIRIVRPKPINEEQSKLWKKIVDRKLATPDTWEVELSKSKDKTASWNRLLDENRLGALALLRNLRNMKNCNVNITKVKKAISKIKTDNILPYQILQSALVNPWYADSLDDLFKKYAKDMEKIDGETIILVDISGSMTWNLSAKSGVDRITVASSLAAIAREKYNDSHVFGFDRDIKEYLNLHGVSLMNQLKQDAGGGTYIYNAIIESYKQYPNTERVIVITDEQDTSVRSQLSDNAINKIAKKLNGKAYIINVGCYENGIAYGNGSKWVHINGFSENTIKWIDAYEKEM